jgi:hypothetical protein
VPLEVRADRAVIYRNAKAEIAQLINWVLLKSDRANDLEVPA